MGLRSWLDARSAEREVSRRDLVARAGRLGLFLYRSEGSIFGPSEYTVAVDLDEETCVAYLTREQVEGVLEIIEWRDAQGVQ
jgi:hypothetical protein